MDEKSQCEALERAQPVLPMNLGSPERQNHDYIRHGTTSIFAALDVATGKVTGQCHRKHRHQEFLKHLDGCYPAREGEAHNTPAVRKCLLRYPRFNLYFTPTGASWLNQIERFFGLIPSERNRRGDFASVKDLGEAIESYIENHNKNPKSFVWTATPEICDKITEAFSSGLSVQDTRWNGAAGPLREKRCGRRVSRF